jgi:hypothetical protein
MMSKFKIGDAVRRVGGVWGSVIVGGVGAVTDVGTDGSVSIDGKSGYDPRRFELAGCAPVLDVYTARKATPVYSGVIKYFPDALQAIAQCSKAGNDQHNPGEPLHWARGKSGDELDALTRHLIDAGTIDTDGVRHSTKVAWRALANLQKELELAGETNGTNSDTNS